VQVAEAEAITDALRRSQNSRVAAARELGMHRSTFFRKVKALGVTLPAEDGRRRGARGAALPGS
jgi:transcriptional regulator of acetoin/glycerol metabolism